MATHIRELITRIFVVTSKLEILLNKIYVPNELDEIDVFFSRIPEIEQGILPPHFEDHGTHFFYILQAGVYFVACCVGSEDPVLMVEFLSSLLHITKYLLLKVSVESLRANVLLMMEVLNEVVVMGHIQEMSLEQLKSYLHTDSLTADAPPEDELTKRLFGIETKSTVPSKPADKGMRNEMFVDLIERVTAVLDSKGTVSHLEVNGGMHINSHVTGNPAFRLAVNEDLVISPENQLKGYGNYVQLDRCTFHNCVDLTEFEAKRIMKITPPTGEFVAMTYLVNADLPLPMPVRLEAVPMEIKDSRDLTVSLKVTACIPENARVVFVKVHLKVPPAVSSFSQQLSGPNQVAELSPLQHEIVWTVHKLPGGSDASAMFRLISGSGQIINQSDVGPAVVDFEISGYTITGLQVRWLKILNNPDSPIPRQWFRRVTLSNSLVIKLE